MIQRQLKLKLTKEQESKLEGWLFNLTGVWNWAIRKIELDAADKIYHSKFEFANLLAGHSRKLGVPSHTLQATLNQAYDAWGKCFKKIRKKPKFKGTRNKLKYMIFPDPILPPKNNRIAILRLGKVKYHKQELPEGKIKRAIIKKRASGWYLCLVIDAKPVKIPHKDNLEVGIDPGYSTLLTFSNGTKIVNPKEFEKFAKRLAQAQRGGNNKLVSRLRERIKNRQKDRNHKLSRDIVSNCQKIAMSKDNNASLQKIMGRSAQNANHSQLRQMIAYKSRSENREYVEVESNFSTMTCSECGDRSGPTGKAGLSVRNWKCTACGAEHDRDVNAAINTFNSAFG